MKCLTPSECSEWLTRNGLIEKPYNHEKGNASYCLQFEPPVKPSQRTAFTRRLFESFGAFQGALIVFTDWSLYEPDEMELMDSIRRGNGEKRRLIDAPGHLAEGQEESLSIGLCYLALMFNWTAYLYLPSLPATVLFWEGDLIDVWASNEQVKDSVQKVVQRFELRITFPEGMGRSP